MNSRERLQCILDHKQPDRLCVDFGSGSQTGIGVSAVDRLRKAVLAEPDYKVKVIDTYQMLGQIDEPLRKMLKLDIVGIAPPADMFGLRQRAWKPFTMPADGTDVLVPGNFNYTTNNYGDYLMYPQGDTSAMPSAMMPSGSCRWDSLSRQQPLVESRMNYLDNCQEFEPLSVEDVSYYKSKVDWYYDNTDAGIYLTLPGLAFGDLAMVPAPWLKNPKGIRDVEEWYLALTCRQDYLYKVFERQCEIGLKNIETLAPVLGDKVQVVFVSGTDFGTQRSPFISPETYRSLFKPFQKAINDKIHELTNWKVFIHSSGSIQPLIPDMIDAGFDILNPVQCTACDMDARTLKKTYGNDIVFWGGGVDSHQTLAYGTPEDVYREVSQRIDIFADGGNFVFNSIGNIQSNTPVKNLIAMFKAVNAARSCIML